MGFNIDFTVEGGVLIDDHCIPAIITQEVVVTGNSISDVIYLTQNGSTVWFTEEQFKEFLWKITNWTGIHWDKN